MSERVKLVALLNTSLTPDEVPGIIRETEDGGLVKYCQAAASLETINSIVGFTTGIPGFLVASATPTYGALYSVNNGYASPAAPVTGANSALLGGFCCAPAMTAGYWGWFRLRGYMAGMWVLGFNNVLGGALMIVDNGTAGTSLGVATPGTHPLVVATSMTATAAISTGYTLNAWIHCPFMC